VVVEEEGEAGEEGRVGWMSIDWSNVVEIDSPMSLNICRVSSAFLFFMVVILYSRILIYSCYI